MWTTRARVSFQKVLGDTVSKKRLLGIGKLINLRELRPCYNIALEQVPVSDATSWDHVILTVCQVVAEAFDEAVTAVDCLMREGMI